MSRSFLSCRSRSAATTLPHGTPAAAIVVAVALLFSLGLGLGTAWSFYDVYAQKVYTTANNSGDHAWQTDGVPLCTADRDQWYPKVVGDGWGNAITVWHDGRGGGNGFYDIYAQRTDASGAVLWGQNGTVVCNAASDQTFPAAVDDGQSGVIVAWWDQRNGPTAIYAQHLNSNGQRLWQQDVAICSHQSGVELPVIASDLNGGAIIAWEDYRNAAATDIYAQRVSGGGAVQWAANGVAVCQANGIQQEIAIVSAGANGAILAWTDQRNLGTTGNDLYAQRINGNGVAQWTANGIAVCSSNGHQAGAALETDQGGGAIAAWEDSRTGTWRIYAQRLDASGVAQWTAQGKQVTAADSYAPALVTDWSSGAIVVWQDYRNGTLPDIYAQRLQSNGNLWAADLAVCTSNNGQWYPRLATDCNGQSDCGAIITWQDERNGASNDDIYAQRVNANGQVMWAANGIAVCTDPAEQERPEIAYAASGAGVIVWMDRREASHGRDFADHDVGNCILTMTDQGILGFLDATQTQGSGFVFPKTASNLLYVGSLWVGQQPVYVANRDYDADPAKEWVVAANPDGHVQVILNGTSDQDIVAGTTDGGAPQPRGLYVRQESWAFANPPDDDFIIVRYFVENRGGMPLAPLFVGVFLDLDIGNSLQNTGSTDAARRLVYMTDGSGLHAGARLLTQADPLANLTLIHNPTYVWPNQYMLDPDKFGFLAGAPQYVVPNAPNPDDWSVLASAGPFVLAPGQTHEVAFAIVGGQSLADLLANADQALERYANPTAAVLELPAGRPAATRLLANAPNPFNPRTEVRFELATPARVKLGVYDPAGRLVRSLLAEQRPAGPHAVVWDGRDDAGRNVASGVYFLRLGAGSFADSRCMLLIK